MPTPAKRSDQRLGHRTAAEQSRTDTSAKATGAVTWPPAPRAWCRPAKEWYGSLQQSGQAVFFEPSDVQAARILGWALTEIMGADKFSPTAFGEVWSAMGDLLTTEGARRKARIELQQPEPEGADEPSAGVSHLADARARMEGRTGTSS